MKIKDILALENDLLREKNKAIVIRENGWWRAYEWSAYLLHHLIEEDDKRLRPTRKVCSLIGDGIIMVGFKDTSAGKYLGEKTAMLSADKDVSYIETTNTCDLSQEECDRILAEWKAQYGIKEPRGGKSNDKLSPVSSIEDILNEIRDFDLARATLIEDVMFISGLKEKVRNICSKAVRRCEDSEKESTDSGFHEDSADSQDR